MLTLINGPIEILNKNPETQAFPICDNAGFTIAEAETYGHALEITQAVTNYNRVVKMLAEAKKFMGKGGEKSKKIKQEIGRFLKNPTLTC